MQLAGAAQLCALVGAVLYLNSLGLDYCLDDQAAILDNGDLRNNVSWINLLRNDFWGVEMSDVDSHKSYRPLTVVTFRLNYMLHELQPLGYHLVNVVLHSAVCYLYVLLCGVVFSEVWPALIAGLLFAVHPIHTEAVSGLVGRADIMSALFMFGALFAYRKVLQIKHTGLMVLWLVVALLCVLCAALSKEIGLTASGLCLAMDLLLMQKADIKALLKQLTSFSVPPWFKTFLARALLFGAFSVVFLAVRIWMNQSPPNFHVNNNPALGFPSPYRQLHWSYLCFLNLWLLLSPSQLCAEYAMDTITPISSLSDPRNLLTLATFAGLIFIGCYGMSGRQPHRRRVLFGVCLLALPFLPASNLFFPVGFVVAERVLYIPSMGFCMLVGYGAWLAVKSKQAKTVALLALVFLLTSHALKTFIRNRDWKNNEALFRSALKVSQDSAKMWDFYGTFAYNHEQWDIAEAVFRRAIQAEPQFTPAYVNLVRLLKKQERYDEAIELSNRTVDLVVKGIRHSNPHYHSKDKRTILTFAHLLWKHTDRYREALKWAKVSLQLEPDWEEAHFVKGKCLFSLGRKEEAITSFLEALRLKPNHCDAHLNLADVYFDLQQLGLAEQQYREVLRLDDGDHLTRFKLVKLVLDHTSAHTPERLQEAIAISEMLRAVEPENGNLTLCLSLLHDQLGQFSEAVHYLEITLELAPQNLAIYLSLNRAYQKVDKYSEAVSVLERLLQLNPDHSEADLELGANYLIMKDYPKAEGYLNSAYTRNPDSEAALVNYGICLIKMGKNRDALKLFQKAHKLFPENESYIQQITVLQKAINKHINTPSETETELGSSEIESDNDNKLTSSETESHNVNESNAESETSTTATPTTTSEMTGNSETNPNTNQPNTETETNSPNEIESISSHNNNNNIMQE